MKQTRSSSITILVALILFVFLFVLFIYTFLHEAGHAIIGLLFGQSLSEFNVSFWNFDAHVGMIGGNLSHFQLAVQSAAGTILPLLLWMMFLNLVPRKASFALELLKLVSFMVVVNTLLTWIGLPVLFLFGKARSDDVTNFLRYSNVSPLLLILTAIILYVSGWLLFLSKIHGLRNEFLLFSRKDYQYLTSGMRATIPLMVSIMIVCVALVFTLNGFAEKNSLNKLSPPQEFIPIAQLDLSKQAYSSETLAQFTLDKPTYVGVFIAIHNIDTAYVDLSVTGPNGFNSVVLHGEGYNAFQDGGLWEKNLAQGVYQVVLTSQQSPGKASVYIKTH